MRVTIIVDGGFCAVDGVGYFGLDMSTVPTSVHAVQWFGESGWVEFVDVLGEAKKPNEAIVSMAPYEAVLAAWGTADYNAKHPAPPPPPTAEQNKQRAVELLAETDWTQIPSVADPAQSTPYLSNVEAFSSYRSAVRAIAVNPTAGVISWPTKPSAVWV